MKYMGNKAKIAKDILPIMLKDYDGWCFVDAFCGSCAIIQDVPPCYIRIANDKNKYLIAMWRSLTIGKCVFPTNQSFSYIDMVSLCQPHNQNHILCNYRETSVKLKTIFNINRDVFD